MLNQSGRRLGLLTSLCKLRPQRSVLADRRNWPPEPLERGGEAVPLALEKARVDLLSPNPLLQTLLLLPLQGRRDARADRLKTRPKQLKFHLLHLHPLPVLVRVTVLRLGLFWRSQSLWKNRLLQVMELYSGLESVVDRRSLPMRLFPPAEAGEGVVDEGVGVGVVVVCSSQDLELGPLAARGRGQLLLDLHQMLLMKNSKGSWNTFNRK